LLGVDMLTVPLRIDCRSPVETWRRPVGDRVVDRLATASTY